MAEDTREIVYYKGVGYYLTKKDDLMSNLERIGVPQETKLVETKHLLTPEEYETQKNNRRSTHVNWIK